MVHLSGVGGNEQRFTPAASASAGCVMLAIPARSNYRLRASRSFNRAVQRAYRLACFRNRSTVEVKGQQQLAADLNYWTRCNPIGRRTFHLPCTAFPRALD